MLLFLVLFTSIFTSAIAFIRLFFIGLLTIDFATLVFTAFGLVVVVSGLAAAFAFVAVFALVFTVFLTVDAFGLLFTAGFGAWQQMKLPNKIYQYISEKCNNF